MQDRLNKTSICSVIFLDIVGYSKESVSAQLALKERFNSLVEEALRDVAENDRIILDTGDGVALVLLGAPEDALFVALTIRDGTARQLKLQPDQPMHLRIGINVGAVRVVSDLNDMPNVIGDGINTAQRVMSFAEPDQILVSRSYFEIASRLSTEMEQMFEYHGVRTDKSVREHELYVVARAGKYRRPMPAEPRRAPLPGWVKRPGWRLAASVAGALALLGLVVYAGWRMSGPAPQPASEAQHASDKAAGAETGGNEKKKASTTHKRASVVKCTEAQRSLNQCR
jgi:class 3 adenylate cyclase